MGSIALFARLVLTNLSRTATTGVYQLDSGSTALKKVWRLEKTATLGSIARTSTSLSP